MQGTHADRLPGTPARPAGVSHVALDHRLTGTPARADVVSHVALNPVLRGDDRAEPLACPPLAAVWIPLADRRPRAVTAVGCDCGAWGIVRPVTSSEEVREYDGWEYDGRYYAVEKSSDVSTRGGYGWKLQDVAPAPGLGAVLGAFYDDTTTNFTFKSWTDRDLPFALVERFVREARTGVPPASLKWPGSETADAPQVVRQAEHAYGLAMDVLDDLPPASREELLGMLRVTLEVTPEAAENILRCSEPFWNALEDAGGLVDSWGGGEFCMLFEQICALLRPQR